LGKVGGFEKSRLLGGCEKEPVIVIDLDIHYKHGEHQSR